MNLPPFVSGSLVGSHTAAYCRYSPRFTSLHAPTSPSSIFLAASILYSGSCHYPGPPLTLAGTDCLKALGTRGQGLSSQNKLCRGTEFGSLHVEESTPSPIPLKLVYYRGAH